MSSASSFESNIINGLIAFVDAHPPHNNNVIWTMKVIVCVGVEELVVLNPMVNALPLRRLRSL